MQAEGILLKNFWARIFSRTSCSYPHKFYTHDASINCAKQEEIILFLTPCTAQWFRFLHPLLCNEESVVHKNFPENEKKVWVRVKKARKTSFSAPPKGPRFSRTRDTRVTGDKAQRSMRKKRGKISPVFSFPPNLVPRVPSYPSPGARRGQVGEKPGNEVASPFLCARIFIYSCPPEPPIPWAGEAWGSLSTRAWGPPRPRAQTSPAKRTEGSGDENDFHRERDDLVQGSFFLLQGVAVRDLIIGTSRSWNDG